MTTKTSCLFALLLLLSLTRGLRAEVAISELEDRIRVTVDGQLFTEWRHKAWAAPFLYPVIGPNGQNLTRHYPMQAGMPGEEADHPHHRSIRFSHSDVNGFNFWWAPGRDKAGHSAEIRLEKIERIVSGKTGEIVFWNEWLGDGKLVLREKVRLSFHPLPDQQLLMDYDVELHAAEEPVLLGDKRDGGLMVRVAASMKVENEEGEKFGGAILNSRGNRDRDAWGKRAEWADYYGPDASGKTVGVAIFDHPGNVRFPTHWHARTYGLITANRFGTDHFSGNYGDHRTVVCSPFGDNCPACASHSGDFTIPAGESITLRHRFFFHHDDPQAAQVAAQYQAYAADPAATLARMQALMRDRQWKAFMEQFADVDFSAWPDDAAAQTAEAYAQRGRVHAVLKNGPQAEVDLKTAVEREPRNAGFWLLRGDNLSNNLHDADRALAAYREAFAITGKGNGWQPLTATIAMAQVLTDQVKPDQAIALLQQYGDMDGMATVWRIKMLRAYGNAYAAQGKEQESLAAFREALDLESPSPGR
ncbi:DUF6807 family protein [Lignipirellula cremea]|uniref:Tetratricopeptide repeat protein n=1 Tax=Lignipirellula cremea TaxID=2528010 RepID=A0A518DZ64_9BACT|nr:DUF6807 family protein [Lignipirellula cremea]QDU97137.1 Tetratricopeptide repeat protein [Lignipirellula cremea]